LRKERERERERKREASGVLIIMGFRHGRHYVQSGANSALGVCVCVCVCVCVWGARERAMKGMNKCRTANKREGTNEKE